VENALFPKRLKSPRTNRNLTQEELGRQINVTKVSVSGYESGNRSPDIETLQKIADVLDTSVDYLLGREGVSNSDVPPEQAEFLKWVEDNLEGTFFYDFHKSPEEQKEEMMETLRMVWEMERKKTERRKGKE